MIAILRLGHRAGRDKRISTHAGLVARAFGAHKIIFTGDSDKKMFNSLKNVVKDWGGMFSIEHSKNHSSVVDNYSKKGYKMVHLTM